MKRWQKRGLLACLGFFCALFGTGCVAVVAAGAAGGGVAYVKGDRETLLEASLEDAYQASREGLERMQYALIQSNKDAISAKLVARTAQDRKVTVLLNEVAPEVTEISVRVGNFGDEALSARILSEIRGAL